MKKHNSSNQIFVNKNNKKVISVQRINSSVFNSPLAKKRILSEKERKCRMNFSNDRKFVRHF